ncbi:hypothetical protein MTR_2g021100 [Medicago truncatula]|uniref:Uncharacterized protein n=1 Tax=Medicago truncatula TaxID=3880 RepID=G7IKC5_MEDTR|nr:hypothetical protein MTR_2g021100 [Medicago truncatula]
MTHGITKVVKGMLGESRGFGPSGTTCWWCEMKVFRVNLESKGSVEKESKKAVIEARTEAFDGLHQSLCTKEGENLSI